MAYTVAQIARLVGGELCGDGDVEIRGVAGIREAGSGDLTFLANRRYERFLQSTRASAIIMAERNGEVAPTVILAPDPYLAFKQAAELFAPRGERPHGVHPRAVVGRDVALGEDVAIGPNAVIEDGVVLGDRVIVHAGCFVGRDCRIGPDTCLHPNVTVLRDTRIGARAIVHSGTVIGSDGFGFATHHEEHHKIPQAGNVEIGDDVEIGANVTIDRATIGTTSIGRGTKIDNLVQIAHNVVIGEHCIVVAQVGISGSTELGRCVTVGGQAGLVGHLKIGDYVKVGGQAGVTKSVPAGASVSGYPARPHGEAMRQLASQQSLPRLVQEMEEIAARLRALESRLDPAHDD